jgi:FkbM family methyltransferase
MGTIARGIRRALPARWQPPARYFYVRARGLLERELPLAVAAVIPGDCVVDVGANVGIYTYAFARAQARVEVFEPQAECAKVLRAFAAATPTVRVHEVALGATSGEATLHVPVSGDRANSARASLRDGGSAARRQTVTVVPLDSFDFSGVTMIKIDVEGAEDDVIAGAIQTIRRHQPLLLVEIEQRHHQTPVSEVFEQLAALDYDGYFLDSRRRIRPIAEFELERDQIATLAAPAAGPYINNFLFQPRAAGEQKRRWDR